MKSKYHTRYVAEEIPNLGILAFSQNYTVQRFHGVFPLSVLLKQKNTQSNRDNEYKILNQYLELFENDKSNYEYLSEIKEILITKKEFDELITIYEQHIENISESNKLFERKVELLEIKIWANKKIGKNLLF